MVLHFKIWAVFGEFTYRIGIYLFEFLLNTTSSISNKNNDKILHDEDI